jgi:hypothetical protein
MPSQNRVTNNGALLSVVPDGPASLRSSGNRRLAVKNRTGPTHAIPAPLKGVESGTIKAAKPRRRFCANGCYPRYG